MFCSGADGVLLRITQLIQLRCSFRLQVQFGHKAGPGLLKVSFFVAPLQDFLSVSLELINVKLEELVQGAKLDQKLFLLSPYA